MTASLDPVNGYGDEAVLKKRFEDIAKEYDEMTIKMALSNKNLRDNAIKLTEDQVNILLGNSEINNKGKNYTAKRVANTSFSIGKIETSTSDNGITDAVHRMVVNNQKLTNTVDNESLAKNTSQLKENTSTLKENTIAKEENANAQKDDISSRVSAMASRGETLTNPESIRKSTTDISKTMTELDQAGVKLMHEHKENFSHVSDIVSDLAKTDKKLMHEHEETFANVSDIVSEMARNNEVLMRDSVLDPELSSSTAQFDSNTASIERNTQAKLENKAATDVQKNAVEQETIAQTTNTTSQSGGDISSRVHELAINGGSLVKNDKEQIKDISATVSELNQSGIKLMQEHEDYSVTMANIISELDQNGQKLMTEHEVPNFGNVAQTVSNVEQALTSTATKADDVATKVSELAKNNEVLMKDVAEVGTTTAASVGKVASETSKFGIFMSSLGSEIIGLFTGAAGALNAVFAWVGVISLVATGIYKIYDALTLTVDEAEEARSKAVSDLSEAQSNLESINSELETTQQRIDELNGKDKLTFTEQSELDRLKEQNKLLQLQADIAERIQKSKQQNLLNTDSDNFDKLYADNISEKNVEETKNYYKDSINALNPKETDISGQIAQLELLQDQYTKLSKKEKEYDDQYGKENGAKYLADDMNSAKESIDNVTSSLNKQLETLTNMKSDYQAVGYENLTDKQKNEYSQIENAIKLIYKSLDPGKYNEISVDDIFNTKDIETTKDDLIELAQAGKLDEKTLNQYPKLTKAIKDADLITKDGTNATKAFINAIIALGDASEDTSEKISNVKELSISDSITKIDDLQTKMKDLDGIMADFVSGDGIDVSNLSGIVDSFQKMKDAGQDVDMTNVENAIKQISDASSLKEAQSALDSLCTEYVYASGVLDGLTDSNASLIAERLKGIGVANAEQIVEQQLEAQKLATKVETEGLTEATLAEIQAYMDEQGYSEQAQQALYQLLLTKIDINNNPIDTASDIQQLINLANAAGAAKNYVLALQNILANLGAKTPKKYENSATDSNSMRQETILKNKMKNYNSVEDWGYADATKIFNYIQSDIKNNKLNANDFITKPHYGGGSSTRSAQNKANKSGGSGSKGGGSGSEKEPTKKDYDWIETLISRINRQVSNLGKTVSATYKTWSTRNNALAQELGSVNQQISAEQQAYNKYMQLANSVGLPEGYASLVRNGTIDVSTIQDDDLNDKIEKYQNYYNKAIEASDAIQDLQDKLAELAKTKFDNISSDFEAQIDQIKHSTTMYQSYIDQVEAEDAIPVRSYYENMIANEQQTISRLKDEYSQLTNAMNEALNTGRIQAYSEEWYNMRASINSVDEAIQDANKSIIEYTKSMKELSKTKFNKISTAYENASGFNDHAKNLYNGLIDQADAEGRFASKDYYSALMDMEKLNIKTLTQESNDLHKSLQEAMNKGDIEEYSDDWYEMMGKINDVDEAIMDANKSLTEYGNSMRQLDWDLFDKQEEYISKIQEESDFLVDLMSNQKLYDDDTGKDTKYATAIKGLHVVNYDVYKAQAQDYAKEIEKINKDLADDPNNMKLIERKQELIKAQQDAIANAEQEKQAIKSLVKDGIDAQLDALQKLIDKYKDSLQATKDLYDYEKNVKEQTDNLAALQKQRQALGGDNSEETQSKIQQLDQQIKDAKSDLEDTEYQQYLSDQEQLLSTFYDETEEWLNARLDDLDGLIQQVIDDTNANAGNISQTITDTTNGVGYTITNAMATIWSTADGNIAGYMNTISGNITGTTATVGDNISKVISTYGDNLNGIAGTTGTAVNNIKELVQYLVDDAKRKKEAEEAAKRAAEAAKKAAEEAQRKAQEAAAQKAAQQQAQQQSRPSSSGGGGSSSGGSSGGGGGAWGSWFVGKHDSYPKNRLDIQRSITDRLKYHNIDSSFSRRRDYYYAMGGSGTYTGSSSQNRWMISQLAAHGYAHGTKSATKGIHLVGEEANEIGISQGRLVDFSGGETVFNGDMTSKLWDFAKDPTSFLQNLSPVMPKIANNNTSSSVNVGGVNIVMNGVNDVETFSKQLRQSLADDVKTQKMVKTFIYKDNNEYKKYR